VKKSSIFLFASAIALGLVGCGGSGNSAAPVTTRDAAVVGVVGIDAWYPTVGSQGPVENVFDF
jgi:ABC-type glycerol-3-phosphate transport system substrate-binding protein